MSARRDSSSGLVGRGVVAQGLCAARAARQSGFTLVELIMFIVITAVVAVTLATAFSAMLGNSGDAGRLTQATQIAQERMELILGRRRALGFNAFLADFDPCTPPGLASIQQICVNFPAGYNVPAPTLTLIPPINPALAMVTVTVNYPTAATLTISALVASY